MFGHADIMFTLVPLFIGAVGILVFGVIIFGVAKGVAEWSNNNQQPVLRAPARLVSKRTNVSHSSGMHTVHDGQAHICNSSTSTSYYVTFELESGERREFCIRGNEWGLLVEGGQGQLTCQGTRYKGFQRQNQHATV